MARKRTYAEQFNPKATPQSKPIPGSGQVKNSAGGYAWQVSDETLLDRFLILGTEGGSYYASEQDMTYQAGEATIRLIKADGPAVVRRVVEISEAGRAPKNDPAVFVLALCATEGDEETKAEAYRSLSRVCRYGTPLFQFLDFMKTLKGTSTRRSPGQVDDGSAGWGQGLKRAIARWYNDRKPGSLGYQVLKYQNRAGWTHADVLQQAHVIPADAEHDAIFAWVRADRNAALEVAGAANLDDPDFVPPVRKRYRHGVRGDSSNLPSIFDAYDRMQRAKTEKQVLAVLASETGFPFEAIPSEWLKKPAVWEALVPNLGMNALFRNLGRMSANGALVIGSEIAKVVCRRIVDGEAIAKDRLHPVSVLKAMMTYKQGHGERGKLSWTPVTKVIDAMDKAFYLSFGNVEPTGKDILLALDVSGSMESGTIAGVTGLTPRIGAAAMAMVTQRVEPNAELVAFSDGQAKNPISRIVGETRWSGGYYNRNDLRPMLERLDISSCQRMDDVIRAMKAVPMGGTDCSLPMRAALDAKMRVDLFVLYTDSETWFGSIHPAQALEEYRQKMGIDSKMVVVGMVGNAFSIADPKDPRSLDVVGFDTATPNLISQFALMQ